VTAAALCAVLGRLSALPLMGEAVDQLAHAMQTAGRAIAAGADDELVVVQGGKAGDAELGPFRAHAWAGDALRLRRWDDLAKVPGAAAPEPGDLLGRLTRLSL
jgi:predicted HD phosphohydrolase